jgi:molybdopterin/thiamine biosynthesis adenylyltransferase
MPDFATTPLTPAQAAEHARLERQQPLSLTLPTGVAIIGCGGVGSWIAYFLALAGCPNLWLFDPDTVSDHNLNRLLLPPSAVGKHKANALADAITSFRPTARLVPMGSFTAELADTIHLSREVGWCAVSTDTLKSRQLIYHWCTNHDSVSYIEAAAEGDTGSIAGSPAEFATPDESTPGYASVPVWVGPCVNAAAMCAAFILHDCNPHSDLVHRFGYSSDASRMVFTTEASPSPPPLRFTIHPYDGVGTIGTNGPPPANATADLYRELTRPTTQIRRRP